MAIQGASHHTPEGALESQVQTGGCSFAYSISVPPVFLDPNALNASYPLHPSTTQPIGVTATLISVLLQSVFD